MPADQRNFGYFTYESGDGNSYNLRCGSEWAAISAHGLAARSSANPRMIPSKQQRPRAAVYVDLTTGRTKQGPIGTAAAWTALAIGDTQDFHVEGETAAVTYTLARKTEEKIPGSVIQSFRPDHA
jgi:hypothetical protein